MKDNLDQFYTDPKLARGYVKFLANRYDLGSMTAVEPSAGAGAFSSPLKKVCGKVIAIDLEPKAKGIRQGDFLQFTPPFGDNIAVVGNPPFGFAASTAVRFFNKAAGWASLVAFIVPRTFRKVSIQDKLNRHFWLKHDEDVPSHAFIRNDNKHDVPCAFQVWERRNRQRRITPTPNVSHIIAYVRPKECDFALRRVGGRAGVVLPKGKHSPSTTYFLQDRCGRARELLGSIDWRTIREQTAGVRSLSKREIAIELAKVA